jgi:hypothetical protein
VAPRRLKVEIAAILAGLVVAMVAAFHLFDRGCDLGLCASRIEAESPSPDHRMRAVVFERDCGATTAATANVSILPMGRGLPARNGNIFVAVGSDDHSTGSDAGLSGTGLDAHWTSNKQLIVVYRSAARLALARARYEEVEISYKKAR